MRRVLVEGWLPALVFALVTGGGLLLLIRWPIQPDGWATVGAASGLVAVVTPPVWWAVVTRRGRLGPARGAAAGGICGVVVTVSFVLWSIWSFAAGNESVTLGYALPFIIMSAMVLIPAGAGVLAIVGAMLGAALRGRERRDTSRSYGSPPDEPRA